VALDNAYKSLSLSLSLSLTHTHTHTHNNKNYTLITTYCDFLCVQQVNQPRKTAMATLQESYICIHIKYLSQVNPRDEYEISEFGLTFHRMHGILLAGILIRNSAPWS
jgi:hypothetical protein